MTKVEFDTKRWLIWAERASKFDKSWGSMLRSQRKSFKRQWYSLYGKDDIPEEFNHSQPMTYSQAIKKYQGAYTIIDDVVKYNIKYYNTAVRCENFKLTDTVCETPVVTYNYSLANNKVCTQEEETKEKDMMTIERDQRDHFSRRLFQMQNIITDFLADKYKINDDTPPKTLAEFIERITTGKFTPWGNKDSKEISYESYIYEMLRWRDPKVLPDTKGFDKALEELSSLTAKCKDKIVAAPITELPGLIEEFENLGKAL